VIYFKSFGNFSNTAAEGKALRWRPRHIDECVPAASGGDGGGASDGSDDDDAAANPDVALRWMPDALQPGSFLFLFSLFFPSGPVLTPYSLFFCFPRPCRDMYHKGSVDIIGRQCVCVCKICIYI
jgi:hypothetical protein